MEDALDYSQPLECDVVIAGAGLAGLVSGAILARSGRRVVLVDGARRIGGRGGASPYRGHWLDGGQRDGIDVTDLQVGWRYGRLAEREAGVRVPLKVVPPALRVHLLDASPPTPGASVVVEGDWSPEGFRRLARTAFGCPEDALPDFFALVGRLAGPAAAGDTAAIEVPLGAWLERNVPREPVRQALLTMVRVIFCEHPERASVGRLMQLLAIQRRVPPITVAFADHAGAGGMQGLMLPWAEAIRSQGGRILLGHRPVEVTFAGSTASGLVALDERHLVLEVRARHTVLAYPIWQALPLLPPERVAAELAEMAHSLEDEQAEAVAWQAGLRRTPRIRASGRPDTHVGWNRLLVGPERRFHGGFQIPSLASRSSAPGGGQLLHLFIARWLRRDQRSSWARARETLDAAVTYLHDYYADLEECTLWSVRQLIERPALHSWFWAPVRRHGIRMPGCDALYLASSSFESDAGPVDIAAHAGLEAAAAIRADG